MESKDAPWPSMYGAAAIAKPKRARKPKQA
jgi:hypothetical protein